MFDRCNPAPTFEGAGTAFLALELSGRCWLVALHAPDADTQRLPRDARDPVWRPGRRGPPPDGQDRPAASPVGVQRSASGTLPPVSCSRCMTSRWSHTFIAAVSSVSAG